MEWPEWLMRLLIPAIRLGWRHRLATVGPTVTCEFISGSVRLVSNSLEQQHRQQARGLPEEDGMTRETLQDQRALAAENRRFKGTGGVSAGNRSAGFVPAFREIRSGRVERARFADGQPAPFHCLEGLPLDWAREVDHLARVCRLRPGIEAGFLRDGRFYTRAEAAAALVSRAAAG